MTEILLVMHHGTSNLCVAFVTTPKLLKVHPEEIMNVWWRPKTEQKKLILTTIDNFQWIEIDCMETKQRQMCNCLLTHKTKQSRLSKLCQRSF